MVADYVKELGGKPFLTDCNTLYVGSRKNALDHMDTAYVNGFSPLQTGCHVIIADGLKGTDETIVPIDGEYVKEAKIGHAIMDADIFISLSHFKGHGQAAPAAHTQVMVDLCLAILNYRRTVRTDFAACAAAHTKFFIGTWFSLAVLFHLAGARVQPGGAGSGKRAGRAACKARGTCPTRRTCPGRREFKLWEA